jgi:hypothetical protein
MHDRHSNAKLIRIGFSILDGHVRVYHGEQTALPRHYVARERLCLRATTESWINAMDGQPFLYVNKEVDPGLIATLKQDVIPWLETNMASTPEQERRLVEDPWAHRFTVVFDRQGYSPELFERLWAKRIAILTYHKFPRDDWRAEEFATHRVPVAGGETVTMKPAERGTRLSNRFWLCEIRKLTDSGHQTSILTTNFQAPMTTVDARALLRRIFQTEADLVPDLVTNTLTVRLHHLTRAAHDQAIEQLLAELNATRTVFSGTNLTLVFKLGSA